MKKRALDLDQEILKDLLKEFDPESFVKGLKLQYPKDIEGAASSFEEYGRNLVRKGIEVGEERTDGVYEIMKEAIEKTGEMRFPFLPQRYIEIAYLSIQPIKRLWTLMNNSEAYSYKLNKCSVYKAIEKEYGEEAARRIACKKFCLAIIDEAFSHFGFNVEMSMEGNMVDNGNCQFMVKRRQK